ncbi:Di-sulfide bridge nucleocytoplasmic transport domain-domain-containing protein [Syncephalastrum racemosum]|uniref:Di-sulfide bridge nucleocytoplasmic transport domain-domain-containing protein n=1 Tax=Syncephalastrum racemosum TaxID=13706 RepID=A0A1X2HUH8_SYNRA|nr:Di-sulfide bridge nucleocytoplasmic transport domain-domain-containing protein [Syncephalastrum racemosum]
MMVLYPPIFLYLSSTDLPIVPLFVDQANGRDLFLPRSYFQGADRETQQLSSLISSIDLDNNAYMGAQEDTHTGTLTDTRPAKLHDSSSSSSSSSSACSTSSPLPLPASSSSPAPELASPSPSNHTKTNINTNAAMTEYTTYETNAERAPHSPSQPDIYPIPPPLYTAPTDPYSHWRFFLQFLAAVVQVTCKIVFYTALAYAGVQLMIALRRDVSEKVVQYEQSTLDEHFYCSTEYTRNECDPSTRVPAMDDMCREWQKCLYRPLWVGRTRVLAETIADVTNGFVDTISAKTMVLLFFMISAYCWAYAVRSRPTLTSSHPFTMDPGYQARYPALPTVDDPKRIGFS